MKFTLNSLSCLIASATIPFAPSTSIAANRTAPPAWSVARTEFEMQARLDRANFSPDDIDGNAGKNCRQALAAFKKAWGADTSGRCSRR